MATPVAVLRSTNPAKLQDVLLYEMAAVTIGRGAHCEVQLTDIRCSTRHCTVLQKPTDSGSCFFVEDQSTNGTFINQALVGKGSCHQLRPGDEIGILRALSVGEESHLAFVFELLPATGSKRQTFADDADVVKKPKLDLDELRAICKICREIIHDCVTLSPCLHNFCEGCFAQCRDTHACPLCRKPVLSLHRNPQIDERINSLAAQQQIGKLSQSFNSLGSAEDGTSAEKGPSKLVHSSKLAYPGCEQCRQPREGFQCPPGQMHVLCHECKCAMPLRAGLPQQCALCEAFFCNLYLRSKCVGIQPIHAYVRTTFSAMPPSALYENPFEQTVLQDYLRLQKLPIDQLAERLVTSLEGQQRIFADSHSHQSDSRQSLSKDSFMCAECARKLWNELLLRYRAQIEKSLPEYLQKREKCRHGGKCRTQRHNISHAQKFSHICQPNCCTFLMFKNFTTRMGLSSPKSSHASSTEDRRVCEGKSTFIVKKQTERLRVPAQRPAPDIVRVKVNSNLPDAEVLSMLQASPSSASTRTFASPFQSQLQSPLQSSGERKKGSSSPASRYDRQRVIDLEARLQKVTQRLRKLEQGYKRLKEKQVTGEQSQDFTRSRDSLQRQQTELSVPERLERLEMTCCEILSLMKALGN